MQSNSVSKTSRMVGIAIFIAIVIILQMVGSFIRFGSFSVSLVLIPIAVGAAVYGAAAGAILGAAFGVVVLINCINGVDAGGAMLWAANPALTALLCIAKGALAGAVSGWVYRALSPKNGIAGAVCAAVICPVINTGIFLAGLLLFYQETLIIWAGETELIYYAFIILAGVNFLLELAVNIILSPVIVRIINISGKGMAKRSQN
jgi:uncharacterized membrane protein